MLPHTGLTPQNLRRIILIQSKRANVGHIGSSLSVVEILVALYGGVLRIASPSDPDRDRFILSKGHAGLALQAALSLRGWISAEEVNTYCCDNSKMGVYPEPGLPGVDFATGSLGMGLSFAAGAALAARMQGSSRRVFCLLSDAECNEGSTWEAAMFAAHHKLSNLCAILDWDGQQAAASPSRTGWRRRCSPWSRPSRGRPTLRRASSWARPLRSPLPSSRRSTRGSSFRKRCAWLRPRTTHATISRTSFTAGPRFSARFATRSPPRPRRGSKESASWGRTG